MDLLAILPEQTFFNTPKRVVVAHFRRRPKDLSDQALSKQLEGEKVLLFAVGEIGETRDAKRLPTDSDLPLLVDTYLAHKAGRAPDAAVRRAAVASASKLFGTATVNLRHFWSKEAAHELGLLALAEDPVEAKRALDEQMKGLKKLADSWLDESKTHQPPANPTGWKTVTLGDTTLFTLSIGKRVLKKDIYQKRSGVPLFSANIRKTFGFVDVANAGSLKCGGCLWSIDSDFDCRGVSPGEKYSITDHCGEAELLTSEIEPEYLARQIRQAGADYGFTRDFRPSLQVMKTLEVDLPVKEDGQFDLELMKAWSDFFDRVEKTTSELQVAIS